METQFNWFQPMANEPLPQRPDLAPPPVSFGFNSTTTSPKASDNRGISGNSSTGNLSLLLDEHQGISLSLTAKDLTLQELKTYMRWYLDILARTNLRTITLNDVYQFLSNFKISHAIKEAINRIFYKITHLINIGEFFALLRVISHSLQGQSPSRALIRVQTAVPVPPSILWKKRQKDDNDSEDDVPVQHEPQVQESNDPLDIDLFTQFMLTGQRPGDKPQKKKRLKKLKTVKFSDEVETNYTEEYVPSPAPQNPGELDYSLSMDQLLSRMNSNKSSNNLAVPETSNRPLSSPDPEEKQILQDMEPQMNHFQNLHSVDTILVDGVPSNIHLQANSDFCLPRNMLPQPPLLKPNMTGPAQMAQMGFYNGVKLGDADYKYNDPTLEGAQRMARLFAPDQDQTPKVSLESFTSQMTGNQPQNMNSPTVTRMRSMSQPSPMHFSPPASEHTGRFLSPDPISTGARTGEFRSASLSPAPPVPPRASPSLQGRPVPPPPRSRKTSLSTLQQAPPPLPAKIPNDEFYQNSENSSTTNILDDLKALQEEVDKIRDLTGGF